MSGAVDRKYALKCESCGCDFDGSYKQHRNTLNGSPVFCCRTCKNRAIAKRMRKNQSITTFGPCPVCGKTWDDSESPSTTPKIYCSKECWDGRGVSEKKPRKPTQSDVQHMFSYNPDDGLLVWRNPPKNLPRLKGKEAGNKPDERGYKQIELFHSVYLTHQIIWLYVHGELISNINHADHDRSNNRISNLTTIGRCKNMKMKSTNKSGVNGVGWIKNPGIWEARIGVNGKRIRLGRFHNFEDAVACRKAADKKYGFHDNHGRGT